MQVDGYAGHNRLGRPGTHCATHTESRTGSAATVNAFGVWRGEQRSRASRCSRLGEKLIYIANQWDGLLVILHDDRAR